MSFFNDDRNPKAAPVHTQNLQLAPWQWLAYETIMSSMRALNKARLKRDYATMELESKFLKSNSMFHQMFDVPPFDSVVEDIKNGTHWICIKEAERRKKREKGTQKCQTH